MDALNEHTTDYLEDVDTEEVETREQKMYRIFCDNRRAAKLKTMEPIYTHMFLHELPAVVNIDQIKLRPSMTTSAVRGFHVLCDSNTIGIIEGPSDTSNADFLYSAFQGIQRRYNQQLMDSSSEDQA